MSGLSQLTFALNGQILLLFMCSGTLPNWSIQLPGYFTNFHRFLLLMSHTFAMNTSEPTQSCGQSYKRFMSVNYDPRVGQFFSQYDSRVNYDRKVLYKIDHCF